jgi:chorismate synthase
MMELIDETRGKGETLGGVFEVQVLNLPVGLGSYIQWDLRLDGLLAWALMSIPGIKGVEVGMGFSAAAEFGSRVHDVILYSSGEKRFCRSTNRAGGLEGGVTNGEPLILRAAMKPIPTLGHPLPSVDIVSREVVQASYERADICAVPAAAVVGEAMVALVIAGAMRDKFGGDSLEEMKRNYRAYQDYVASF